MPIIDDLLHIIHNTASEIPTFDQRLGPGADKGNGATKFFVKKVNEIAAERWPNQVQQNFRAVPNTRMDFDLYVPSECTAIEIALSLRNSVSEYEKDIFKALLAQSAGLPLKRLILIGKNDSVRIRNMPASVAIRNWAWEKHSLKIEVHEIAAAASVTMADDAPGEED